MNLHEFQAKQMLKSYGLPVPESIVAHSVDEANAAAAQLQGNKWVVKAQVHAGGRGKAGGVKLVNSKEELSEAVRGMLHTNLVTYQTDEKGQPINSVLIEETCDIAQELYLGAVLDRASQRVVIMASLDGGVDIEKVANENPDRIVKVEIDPLLGVMPYQCRELGYSLNLSGKLFKQFSMLCMQIGKIFIEKDLSIIEINPLVITGDGDLLCLDCKMNIDSNALYRQASLREMWDPTQEDEREIKAKEWELNYIALDGDIGCMVNGAGLAMATMDLIKLTGGEPANFLDVGGGATKERVSEAFKIILSDEKVKGVLVNIFGGIVRCDLIAEGIIAAVEEVGVKVPVVVRLEGNNATLGAELLDKSGLNIIAATSLQDAAEQVVKSVRSAA